MIHVKIVSLVIIPLALIEFPSFSIESLLSNRS